MNMKFQGYSFCGFGFLAEFRSLVLSRLISFLTLKVMSMDAVGLGRRRTSERSAWSSPALRKRLVWCGLALVVLFFVHPLRALADDKPILCASDGGKTWYFSFGTDVFEITPVSANFIKTYWILVGNTPPLDLLVPPDPKVPTGCYGNPQQLSSFSSIGWPRLQPVGYNGDLPDGVFVLELAERRGVEPPAFAGPINVQNLSRFGGPCYQDAVISELSDGSFYCSYRKDDLKNLNTRSLNGWVFVASKKTYALPLGYPFIVMGVPYDALWQSMYQVDPYMSIWYRWHMPYQAKDIDLRYFIDVDKSVLNALDGLKVHNYPWPQQKIYFWPARPPLQP